MMFLRNTRYQSIYQRLKVDILLIIVLLTLWGFKTMFNPFKAGDVLQKTILKRVIKCAGTMGANLK